MEVQDIRKIKTQVGTASTVKAEELVPVYCEGVSRFLNDNKPAMGDKWVRTAGGILFNAFEGKNKEGDILGSNIPAGVAIATFCPEIPLITGQQSLGLYEQAGNRNPFGDVYVDFGVQLDVQPNREFEVNPEQAKILLEDFNQRGIKIGEGRVLNFNQLRLQADKSAGLVYKLAEDLSSEDVAVVSAYPFQDRIGKNGLFRAYLGRRDWYALGGNLSDFNDGGRVVRYDAEGVAREKQRGTSDLVDTLTREFLQRFR